MERLDGEESKEFFPSDYLEVPKKRYCSECEWFKYLKSIHHIKEVNNYDKINNEAVFCNYFDNVKYEDKSNWIGEKLILKEIKEKCSILNKDCLCLYYSKMTI